MLKEEVMLRDFLEAVLKDDAESAKKEKIRKKVASLKIKGDVDLRTLKKGDNVRFKDGTVAIVTDFRELFRFKEETIVYSIKFSSEVRGKLNDKRTDDSWVYTINGSFEWPDKEERQYCNNIVEVYPVTRVESKRWMPGKGEDYFLVNEHARVQSCINRCPELADKEHSLGLIYKTEREAQEALEIRQATVKLLDLCNPDGYIELSYHADIKDFVVVGEDGIKKDGRSIIMSPYHFSTRADARKALKEIGTRMLKKIYNID